MKLPPFLLLAIGIGAGLILQTFRLDEAQKLLGGMEVQAAANVAALAAIQYRADLNDQAHATLRSQLDSAHQSAAERTTLIRRLTNENQELRAWRDAHLPAAAVRLYERPALSGGAGYRDWVSDSHSLSPAPSPAADQR